jgi:hypothetical protein
MPLRLPLIIHSHHMILVLKEHAIRVANLENSFAPVPHALEKDLIL